MRNPVVFLLRDVLQCCIPPGVLAHVVLRPEPIVPRSTWAEVSTWDLWPRSTWDMGKRPEICRCLRSLHFGTYIHITWKQYCTVNCMRPNRWCMYSLGFFKPVCILPKFPKKSPFIPILSSTFFFFAVFLPSLVYTCEYAGQPTLDTRRSFPSLYIRGRMGHPRIPYL